MRSVIDILDLSRKEVDGLIETAMNIIACPEKYADIMHGKKLATLFFEPSTRTRLSFTAAMMELGGNVLGFSEASSSSAAKGESIADTARVVSCYADIIAIRSPKEGAAFVAAQSATVPVINAGDGSHFHPTQTFGDLLTIYRCKGRIDNLTIGFCGDLKYGRTVHSLINALSRYEGIRIVLISPKELALPNYMKKEVLDRYGMSYVETDDLEAAMPDLDVLYMTRMQRERFSDMNEYERLKDSYILTVDKLANAKSDMHILHPLPRVNEISVKVDNTPHAKYFEQAENGKYMRMALILMLMNDAKVNPIRENRLEGDKISINERHCHNPKCVVATEQELDNIFRESDGVARCIYCDSAADE